MEYYHNFLKDICKFGLIIESGRDKSKENDSVQNDDVVSIEKELNDIISHFEENGNTKETLEKLNNLKNTNEYILLEKLKKDISEAVRLGKKFRKFIENYVNESMKNSKCKCTGCAMKKKLKAVEIIKESLIGHGFNNDYKKHIQMIVGDLVKNSNNLKLKNDIDSFIKNIAKGYSSFTDKNSDHVLKDIKREYDIMTKKADNIISEVSDEIKSYVNRAKKILNDGSSVMLDVRYNIRVVNSNKKEQPLRVSAFDGKEFETVNMDYDTFEKFIEKKSKKDNLNESVSGTTALKTRNEINKILKNIVDSGDIVNITNFESYEDNDKISLKMSVFNRSKSKLANVADYIKDTLIEDSWEHASNGKDNIFKKDDVLVKLYGTKKIFLSSASKNRELPALRLEVIGPKLKNSKMLKEDDVSKEELRRTENRIYENGLAQWKYWYSLFRGAVPNVYTDGQRQKMYSDTEREQKMKTYARKLQLMFQELVTKRPDLAKHFINNDDIQNFYMEYKQLPNPFLQLAIKLRDENNE